MTFKIPFNLGHSFKSSKKNSPKYEISPKCLSAIFSILCEYMRIGMTSFPDFIRCLFCQLEIDNYFNGIDNNPAFHFVAVKCSLWLQ